MVEQKGRAAVSTAIQKPLFIPLRREYFAQFESGDKQEEYRPFGPRWNERTCTIGRAVVLSLGYGKARRLHGRIVGFSKSHEICNTDAWRACYGAHSGPAACIRIALEKGEQ